jgi:PKHD-type hydroxylase
MMLHIPGVLTVAAVERCRKDLARSHWKDGRITAGHQSAQVKHNQQLSAEDADARALGDIVLEALERSPLFISAVLPQRVFPPLFNRYDQEMSFGAHVDNAIRGFKGPGGAPARLRTDVSATLFLSDPDSYDGGDLVVEDTYGSHAVKLPAGDMIVYPASSLHHVTPVTRGLRLASFFWVQSLVREGERRRLLFDLDMSIVELTKAVPASPALVMLTGVYHNLLRAWSEP